MEYKHYKHIIYIYSNIPINIIIINIYIILEYWNINTLFIINIINPLNHHVWCFKIPIDHPFLHSHTPGMADLDVSRLLAGLQRGAVPGGGRRLRNWWRSRRNGWLEIQWEIGVFFHGTHSPSSPSKNGWISMNFNEIHGRTWWLFMKFHHWHLWFKWIERDLPGWSWGYSQACYGKSMWNSEGMTTRPSDFWLHKLLWDGPLICT